MSEYKNKLRKERKAQAGIAGKAVQQRSSAAGKGDRNSAAWINSDKYQRSMRANEAYAAGEITLEEWRAIVHPKSSEGQGE
tara:strand:+ start:195 stop:437 length:243 start_codon:yes stop_codon:yes gene_type:complete